MRSSVRATTLSRSGSGDVIGGAGAGLVLEEVIGSASVIPVLGGVIGDAASGGSVLGNVLDNSNAVPVLEDVIGSVKFLYW